MKNSKKFFSKVFILALSCLLMACGNNSSSLKRDKGSAAPAPAAPGSALTTAHSAGCPPIDHTNDQKGLNGETLDGENICGVGHMSARHKNPDGKLGGFVETTANVGPNATVGLNATVCDTSQVLGSAQIIDQASTFDQAQVSEQAVISGCAQIQKNAQIFGSAQIYDSVIIFDNVKISGSTQVHGVNTQIWSNDSNSPVVLTTGDITTDMIPN